MHSTASAAESLLAAMNNPSVPWGVRVKIMQDVLDRGGLAAAQTHRLVVAEDDPVESLFRDLLSDPDNLAAAPLVVRGELVAPEPDPAQDALDRQAESWVEDAEVTPLRHEPDDYGPVGPHSMSPPSSTKIPRHIAEGLDLHPRRR
ncbi:hypothetical protein [Nocardioides sp. CFH 31398]|uniref:hypothetical protein n=1 Tax=Nocardioides sp. CFH 31398 TaxID=2919579 RepID=UPI001F06FA82|nr:hypothetical protein [Nocardioides sp. CFH 31398]MCH1867065.1 hypothetical protein [Nocardioides sp. CFH 31398]